MTKLLLTLSAAMLAVTTLAGCGGGENASSGSDSGQKLTIGLLPKKKGTLYFNSCADGAQAAARELGGVQVVYDGPEDGSADKGASLIEQWTLKKYGVIAVSPSNPDVLANAMRKARAAGIHVITWDADAPADAREFFVNQATAEEIGNAMVDAMAKDLGGDNAEGQLAIISADATAANQNAWIKYMEQRLKKYPKLSLVEKKFPGEDQKVAMQMAQDLMKAYPGLRGIFGISSESFPAAAEAVRAAGKSGQVLVTGLGTPNDMRKFVKPASGEAPVKSFVLWNTQDLGYLTVQAANALASGKLKAGDRTFNAGKLGEKKIEGDNILLGQIIVFTKDNIDQYNF